MGIAALYRFGQFVHNMLGCRSVRVSHAKIDNVFTARSSGSLQLIDYIEDIGRQAFDSGKFVHEQVFSTIVKV